jgi:hypothetical protein
LSGSAPAAGNKKGGDKIAAVCSSHFLGHPVAELEILPNLAPLVAVFEGFFGMMLRFTERMLRITNRFAHDFECFHHIIFLSLHCQRKQCQFSRFQKLPENAA